MENENPALKPNQKLLKNCDPLWITHRDKNVGIMIRCPIADCPCGNIHLAFWWSHPSRPSRNIIGDTFENLTFETKVDGHKFGCTFYGELNNGLLTWEMK